MLPTSDKTWDSPPQQRITWLRKPCNRQEWATGAGRPVRMLLSGVQVTVDRTEVTVVEGGEEVRIVEGRADRFASRLGMDVTERWE